MKKEKLKELGLTDEQIESIMSENGKDIQREQLKAEQAAEKSKQELENLQSEIKTTKETLDQANVQIENFKGMDVEGTKKAAEEWKTKYEQFETQSKAEKETFEKQLKDQQYNFKLNEIAGQHKFVDDLAKEAFINNLKKQEFKFGEDGTLQGANDYINKFKEDHKGIFAIEAPVNNEPQIQQFAAATGGQIEMENKNPFGFNFNLLRKPTEK